MRFEMDNLEVRIDKYLWAIRIFKTRSMASDAIDGGKVKRNGDSIKSSKKAKVGDKYHIKKEGQILEIEVVKLIKNRVAATIAKDCYNELLNEITIQRKSKSAFYNPNIEREKGKGRPTKKDRRELSEFWDDDF